MLYAILTVLALLILILSTVFFNRIRRSVYGIIGIGSSFIFLIGFVMVVAFFVVLFEGGFSFNLEVIFTLLITLAAVAYIVYVLIVKCNTVGERIWVPFAAFLIACGTFYRFLGSIFLHIEMGDGSPFPDRLHSAEDEWLYEGYNHATGMATYLGKSTGQRIQIHRTDVSGNRCPQGFYTT